MRHLSSSLWIDVESGSEEASVTMTSLFFGHVFGCTTLRVSGLTTRIVVQLSLARYLYLSSIARVRHKIRAVNGSRC